MFFQSITHYFRDKEISCQTSLFLKAELRDYSTTVIEGMTPSHAYNYLTGPSTEAQYHCQVKRVKNNRYQFSVIDANTEELLMLLPVSEKEPGAILAEGLVDFVKNIKDYT